MNSVYAVFFDPKNHPGLISYLNKNYNPIYIKSKSGEEEWIEYSNDGNTVDWHNSYGDSYRHIYDNDNRIVYKRSLFNSGTSRTKLKKLDTNQKYAYITEHDITEEVYVYDNDGELKSSQTTTTTKKFVRYEEY